jgi:hypothetical protein
MTTPYLQQLDPDNLQNVVMEQGRRIAALERALVELNDLGEAAPFFKSADGKIQIGENGMSIDSVFLSMMDRWNSLGDSLLFDDGTYINAVKYNPVDGCIYIAGRFAVIGGVSAAGVAKFDPATRAFSALGAGYGTEACCLAIDPSGNVYVAGGGAADVIKKWDGSSMTTLSMLTGPVYALACDSAGNLYAGGTFVNKVAMYNGVGWNPCGTAFAGTASTIRALAVDPNDNVYIGGSFVNIGDANGDFIVMWDRATYNSVGGGLNGNVSALSIDSAGRVYAVGWFTNAGGDANADQVAVLDGGSWMAIGGIASPLTAVLASSLYHDGIAVDANGKVYVAIGALADHSLNAAYLFDGSQWLDLNISYTGSGTNLSSVDVDPISGKAYFGGDAHVNGLFHSFGTYGPMTLADALDYLFARIADNAIAFGDYINSQVPANSLRYVSPYKGTLTAIEANVEFTAPFDMQIDLLGVVTTTTQPATNNMTVTLRRNGVASLLVVYVNASAVAGTYERIYPIAFLKGDRISIEFDNNAGLLSASVRRYYLRGRMIRA